MGASCFNDMEMDAIGEIMNISLGASATAVSTLLGAAVNITTPVVRILNRQDFEFKRLEPAIGVEVAYTQGLAGNNIMMFSRNDVRLIVGMLMGAEIPGEAFEMDEINRSAICEVMNQMMGSSATALAEFLGFSVNISTPMSFEIENESSFKDKYFTSEESRVVVRFSLEVEGILQSEFLNIMSLELAKCLLEPFGITAGPVKPIPAGPEDVPAALQPPSAEALPVEAARPAGPDSTSVPLRTEPDPMMLQLLSQMQQSQVQMMEIMRDLKSREKTRGSEASVIRPVNAMELEDDNDDGVESGANQEMLMKVPLEISVEIGRTKKKVKEILEYAQGSLVVLDKMAGEQADLFVNGQCIAKGDIVVVEDNFGIRITEIVTRSLNPESL